MKPDDKICVEKFLSKLGFNDMEQEFRVKDLRELFCHRLGLVKRDCFKNLPTILKNE
eukprot:UN32790